MTKTKEGGGPVKNKQWMRSALALGASFAAVWTPAVTRANSDAEFALTVNAARTHLVREVKPRRLAEPTPSRVETSGQAGGSIVRDQTTVARVDLNSKTVKCSAADYSRPLLKVLVPALAELTVLNHRNTREGAPCIAAGPCGEIGPQDILRRGDGVDEVPIRVVLKKVAELDGGVCRVSLLETVTAVIRGVPFTHERWQAVADREAPDCR